MGLAGVEGLLQASMGLSAMSVGSPAVARAVQERLAICNLKDVDAYLEHLRVSRTELQALIEAVVVPETWFFRDRHAFTTLTRMVHEEWVPAHPDGMLTLLSLPCSTGEEPYSIAMALLDAHIPASRFRVDAVDISSLNIAQGIRAVYGRNSFRSGELGLGDHHFEATTAGRRVRETVRRQVHFQQGNLFDPDFLPGVAIYDVIFCRNVLIYFDRPTQDRAIGVLNRLLHEGGMLFVAPAETAVAASHGMASTNEPLAFAFRKASSRPSPKKRTDTHPVTPRVPVRAVAPARPERQPARVAFAPATGASRGVTAAPPSDPAELLIEATRLANEGHLVEAARCCEEYLRRSGPSATAFSLLGLVCEATGNHQEASGYYRKAIYLDPDHYEAQIQLALLMEKQGDATGARVLRNRARRLEQKSRASHE